MSLPLIFLRQGPAENVGWPELPPLSLDLLLSGCGANEILWLGADAMSSPLSALSRSGILPHCGIHSIDLHISTLWLWNSQSLTPSFSSAFFMPIHLLKALYWGRQTQEKTLRWKSYSIRDKLLHKNNRVCKSTVPLTLTLHYMDLRILMDSLSTRYGT